MSDNDQDATVAEILLDEIAKLGVEYVFLVPGAQITPLAKLLYAMEELTPVVATHELAAAFMAVGYARASGKMGVVMATGAPGAAYMTGAGITAKADDVPVVFITGNIPQEHFGRGEFQDASPKGTNDSAIYKATVKETIVCSRPEEVTDVVIEMVRSITRLRPLHVQIPVDVQLAKVDSKAHQHLCDQHRFASLSLTEGSPDISLDEKRRYLFLLGQRVLGIVNINSLKEIARRYQIGIITDMKTRGIISESEHESLGYVGFNSDPRALEALNKASILSPDHIFSVGVKEELIKQYIDPSASIMRLTPGALNRWIEGHLECPVEEEPVTFRRSWLDALSEKVPLKQILQSYDDKVSYLEMFDVISKVMPKETVYCLDAGQLRRAGSIFLECHYPRTLIQSDTLSPMGSGICAAIGAKLAVAERPVIALVGDGSMLMHGMEVVTAVRYGLPIIFIVGDNQAYVSLPKREEIRGLSDLPKVDWIGFARSVGLEAEHSKDKETFLRQLEAAKERDRPSLLWVDVPDLLDDEFKQTKTLEYKNWLSTLKDRL